MTRPCLTVVSGAAHGNARGPVDRLKGGTVTSINHQQPGKHVVISSTVYQYVYHLQYPIQCEKTKTISELQVPGVLLLAYVSKCLEFPQSEGLT